MKALRLFAIVLIFHVEAFATTPRAAVVFNNSTGSDTAASGLGPGTAVTGTAAAHTNGSASTTITLTNAPNLSAVQSGDMLWLNTGSGRQFTVISSADDGADTVTVDDSFNIASGSAVDYAIGGKRATLDDADSRTIFGSDGWKALWEIEVESTGSAYTLTSAISVAEITNRMLTITGTGGIVEIRQTANANNFTFGGSVDRYWLALVNLKLTNSNATKTNAIGVNKGGGNTGGLLAIGCVFGDATNQLLNGVSWGGSSFGGIRIYDSEITDCTSTGIHANSQNSIITIDGCNIHDNGLRGIYQFAGTSGIIQNSIIWGNSTDGYFDDAGAGGVTSNVGIKYCTFHDNGGDGIDIDPRNNDSNFITVHSNNFTNNGNYGIRSTRETDGMFLDYNNFNGNTSGARSGVSAGANDLAVNPSYVNAATGNFTPQESTLEGAAFPPSVGASNFGWIGAVQPEDSGSGGPYIAIRTGGNGSVSITDSGNGSIIIK